MTNRVVASGIHMVSDIIKNIYNENDDALKLSPDIQASGKITRVISKFIVSPNVVVDDNLKYMDNSVFTNIVKTELTVFSAIVVEAIRVMVEIHGVKPVVAIDKLNNNNILEDLDRAKDLISGSENFDYIANLLNPEAPLPNLKSGIENGKSNLLNNTSFIKDVGNFSNVYELQVKMLTKNGNEAVLTLPILIYPNIRFTKVDTLINSMVASDAGKRFSDVFNDYRAGLKSLTDLMFATSLVKEYRKRKITNENDFVKYLNKTDKITTFNDILHNKNSFSKNFNIYIFDSNYINSINTLLKGNVYKDKYKNELTNKLFAFSVSFVDIESEELTLLMDSIPSFSVLSFSMLQKEKGSNDISSVIKELTQNKTPF